MKSIYLVVHYGFEQPDVVAISTSKNKAYALRNDYIVNYEKMKGHSLVLEDKKSLIVLEYPLDKVFGSIYK